MSVSDFDDITPLELDIALNDHSNYHFSYAKEAMNLQRYIGVILRNKGLKQNHQYRNVKKFYKFWWEEDLIAKIPNSNEWKQLDKRYIRPVL